MKKLLLLLFVAGVIACTDKASPATLLIFYLNEKYNSADSTKDVILIKAMNGVQNADFVSKEDAKQIFIAGGNEDWDKVLDFNPLPESIEVEVKGNITTEQLTSLEKKISDHLRYISSVERFDPRKKK